MMLLSSYYSFFFFFNDTATTEIYTLSLHDALPISSGSSGCSVCSVRLSIAARFISSVPSSERMTRTRLCVSRSEEHTSELQSQSNLVCRLLLEKKKKRHDSNYHMPIGTSACVLLLM